jgi:hypothetical protein
LDALHIYPHSSLLADFAIEQMILAAETAIGIVFVIPNVGVVDI